MYSRPASWQRAATRISGRALALIVGLLVLLTLAGLLYLTQASTAAEMRYSLVQREREETRLQEQITALRCQVAQHQSVGSLQERAQKLGLVDASPSDPQVICYVPADAAMGANLSGLAQPEEPRSTIQVPAPLEWLLLTLVHGFQAAQFNQ